jgi:hypothetical protein
MKKDRHRCAKRDVLPCLAGIECPFLISVESQLYLFVIPAKAGIQSSTRCEAHKIASACAGMTSVKMARAMHDGHVANNEAR